MSNYFIGSSTGRMEEGKALTWQFPEFDAKFPIRVGKIEKDKYISYYWNDADGKETFVQRFHLQRNQIIIQQLLLLKKVGKMMKRV